MSTLDQTRTRMIECYRAVTKHGVRDPDAFIKAALGLFDAVTIRRPMSELISLMETMHAEIKRTVPTLGPMTFREALGRSDFVRESDPESPNVYRYLEDIEMLTTLTPGRRALSGRPDWDQPGWIPCDEFGMDLFERTL